MVKNLWAVGKMWMAVGVGYGVTRGQFHTLKNVFVPTRNKEMQRKNSYFVLMVWMNESLEIDQCVTKTQKNPLMGLD